MSPPDDPRRWKEAALARLNGEVERRFWEFVAEAEALAKTFKRSGGGPALEAAARELLQADARLRLARRERATMKRRKYAPPSALRLLQGGRP